MIGTHEKRPETEKYLLLGNLLMGTLIIIAHSSETVRVLVFMNYLNFIICYNLD